MAKVVDITDKLSFDENPKIRIKDEEFEVNTDARTMLEIMGVFSSKEKDRKRIDRLKLTFKDFMKMIEESMALIMGEDSQGEQ